VLGYAVTKDEAAKLLQTDEGRNQLSPERGLWQLLKTVGTRSRSVYTETFGNEVFFTEVTGILDGPLNIGNLTKAIAALGGKHTNLQVPVDRDVTIADRTFKAGTLLNTGLDVSAGSSCHWEYKPTATVKFEPASRAACHAAVDKQTGRILEGAQIQTLIPAILALASNSASWFRQTGVNPTKV